MTVPLASELEKLSLIAKELDPAFVQTRLANEESGIAADTRPRKELHLDAKQLLKDLEDEFLNPSTKFSSRWLNQLQK